MDVGNSDPVIEIRGICMWFGSAEVLRGVNPRVHGGEVPACTPYATPRHHRPQDAPELVSPTGLTEQADTSVGKPHAAEDATGYGRGLLAVAPGVLRRMARRESGAGVAACRRKAMRRPV